MLYGEVDPAELAETCGLEPSFVCREVLERTGSTTLAGAVDWIFAKPVTIAIILIVAWVVVRILDRIIDRFVRSIADGPEPTRQLKRGLRRTPIVHTLPEGSLDTAVSLRAAPRAQTLGHVLRSIAAGVVWGLAALMVLGELGIDLGPLIAAAGIAGVALGFGAQSLVKDFLAGIFILIEDQYGVGDIIDVGEVSGTLVTGTVESVSLRATRLRSTNGTVWHVPNGTILRVGNMSQQWARALLDVSVAYGSDLDLAQAVIKAAADEAVAGPGVVGGGARGARAVGRREPGPRGRDHPPRGEDAAGGAVPGAPRAAGPHQAGARRGRGRHRHHPAHAGHAAGPRHPADRRRRSRPGLSPRRSGLGRRG